MLTISFICRTVLEFYLFCCECKFLFLGISMYIEIKSFQFCSIVLEYELNLKTKADRVILNDNILK